MEQRRRSVPTHPELRLAQGMAASSPETTQEPLLHRPLRASFCRQPDLGLLGAVASPHSALLLVRACWSSQPCYLPLLLVVDRAGLLLVWCSFARSFLLAVLAADLFSVGILGHPLQSVLDHQFGLLGRALDGSHSATSPLSVGPHGIPSSHRKTLSQPSR